MFLTFLLQTLLTQMISMPSSDPFAENSLPVSEECADCVVDPKFPNTPPFR